MYLLFDIILEVHFIGGFGSSRSLLCEGKKKIERFTCFTKKSARKNLCRGGSHVVCNEVRMLILWSSFHCRT